jgi:hypothetical protein
MKIAFFKNNGLIIIFLIQVKENAVCLICQEFIAMMKEYNTKINYGTKHAAKYEVIQGQLRIDKLVSLMKNVQVRSLSLKKMSLRLRIKY